MFGRKKENQVLSDNDAQQLLVSIDNIIAGDFSDVSVSSFNDPVIGDKLNAMLLSIKQVNNPVVMRLNETMEVIGDNGLMKDTFEQVILRILSTIYQKPLDISAITPMMFFLYHRM